MKKGHKALFQVDHMNQNKSNENDNKDLILNFQDHSDQNESNDGNEKNDIIDQDDLMDQSESNIDDEVSLICKPGGLPAGRH